MSDPAAIVEDMRARILEEPDMILGDPDVMRALIAANERAMGGNIVDLRGVAFVAALNLVPTERFHRLRREAQMSHERHA